MVSILGVAIKLTFIYIIQCVSHGMLSQVYLYTLHHIVLQADSQVSNMIILIIFMVSYLLYYFFINRWMNRVILRIYSRYLLTILSEICNEHNIVTSSSLLLELNRMSCRYLGYSTKFMQDIKTLHKLVEIADYAFGTTRLIQRIVQFLNIANIAYTSTAHTSTAHVNNTVPRGAFEGVNIRDSANQVVYLYPANQAATYRLKTSVLANNLVNAFFVFQVVLGSVSIFIYTLCV